jgi:hypothetical protein
MGRCGSIGEYQAAGKYMGLTNEQINWCAHHMVPGMFVGQVGEGKWRYPFLFRIPKMNPLKPVTDSQADQSLAILDKFDTEKMELTNWPASGCVIADNTTVSKNQIDFQLTDSELRLLKAIVDNPMLPSSDYVKLARISPNTLAKCRPILIQKGFIKEHLMDSGKRGRTKRIWEPMEFTRQVVMDNFAGKGI